MTEQEIYDEFLADEEYDLENVSAYEYSYWSGWNNGLKRAAILLRNKIRPQSEWIPVSERLPEQANQSYLVTVDYGDGLISSCQRFFFGEGIGWNDDCVIAWQPLPEPYKKGDAE